MGRRIDTWPYLGNVRKCLGAVSVEGSKEFQRQRPRTVSTPASCSGLPPPSYICRCTPRSTPSSKQHPPPCTSRPPSPAHRPHVRCLLLAHSHRSGPPGIISQEIDQISLHNPIPITARLYGAPFLCELLDPLCTVYDGSHELISQHSTRCWPTHTMSSMPNGSSRKNGRLCTASSSLAGTRCRF